MPHEEPQLPLTPNTTHSAPIPPSSGAAPAEAYGTTPHLSEFHGTLPNSSDAFGTVPQPAERVGTIPRPSASHRTVPNSSGRKPTHSLTVREVARLFESAGVARTERSITNWCLPNRTGIARLDSYFDPNERRYFITQESVDLAIEEEKAKANRQAPNSVPPETPPSPLPNRSEPASASRKVSEDPEEHGGGSDLRALRQELLDLKITNRAKDMFIEQLQSERAGFATERQTYIDKLLSSNHRVGQLEAQLIQLPEHGRANDNTG